jgi:hypothetical protein
MPFVLSTDDPMTTETQTAIIDTVLPDGWTWAIQERSKTIPRAYVARHVERGFMSPFGQPANYEHTSRPGQAEAQRLVVERNRAEIAGFAVWHDRWSAVATLSEIAEAVGSKDINLYYDGGWAAPRRRAASQPRSAFTYGSRRHDRLHRGTMSTRITKDRIKIRTPQGDDERVLVWEIIQSGDRARIIEETWPVAAGPASHGGMTIHEGEPAEGRRIFDAMVAIATHAHEGHGAPS